MQHGARAGILLRMPLAIIAGSDEEIRSGKGQLMLTRTQAAARLGVSERRVNRFVEDGDLTPYEEKIFNSPLYPNDEVEHLRVSRLKRSY